MRLFLIYNFESPIRNYTSNNIVKIEPNNNEPNNNEPNNNKSNNIDINKVKVLVDDFFLNLQKSRLSQNINSSGRLTHWKNSIRHIQNNFVLGSGPQADRLLVGENISNIVLYALLCGGIFSLSSLLFIIFVFCKSFFNKIFMEKFFISNKDPVIFFSIYCIGFLIFRGLAENSFGVYSLDFITFLACCIPLKSFFEKTRNDQS